MKNITENDLLVLKTTVQEKFGKELLYPKDCEALAVGIYEDTGRQISASTLKRLFGFVKSNSSMSKYSLDSLAFYMGFENWDAYIEKISEPEFAYWKKVRETALKFTDHSLRYIKSKGGISFEKTVRRSFATELFGEFFLSAKTAWSLVGPAGYGKTIIAAQIACDNFVSDNALNKDDIAWLIELDGLPGNGFDFVSWLTGEEENSLPSILEHFAKNPRQRKGRIVIMLDSFEDYGASAKKTDFIIGALYKFIQNEDYAPFLKIILFSRPATWMHFGEMALQNQLVSEKWFMPVFKGGMNDIINIPLLGINEVENVLKNAGVNQSEKILLNTELLQIIRFPYFLRIYLALSQYRKEINSEIDLLYDYFQEKILAGPLSDEKLNILTSIVKIADDGHQHTVACSRLDLKTELRKMAWLQLVESGVITEITEPKKYLGFETYLRFSHAILYEFVLINSLLDSYRLSQTLVRAVLKKYEGSELMYSLLKWLVKYAFRENELSTLREIFDYLTRNYKWDSPEIGRREMQLDLILFIGDEMNKDESIKQELLPYYVKMHFSNVL